MQCLAVRAGHLRGPSSYQECDALTGISIVERRCALRHLMFKSGGDPVVLIAGHDAPGAARSVDETSCREFAQSVAPLGNSTGQPAILSWLRKIRHGSRGQSNTNTWKPVYRRSGGSTPGPPPYCFQ